MSASSLSQSSNYSVHPLHPAVSDGTVGIRVDLTQTILVCPLPLPGLAHAELLPELSHELKTPLAGIMGLAQVLQHQSSMATNREHQYADLIYQKSQQLLVSINDLFDLAQMSTRQFVLQLRPVDLTSILKTALQTSQQITALETMQFTSVLQEDQDCETWMVGDQSRLEQLFTHLMGYLLSQNSLQQNLNVSINFSSNWLTVTISVPSLQLSDSEQGYLGLPYQSSEPNTIIPGRSSAVLKFLLAQQLAHLQGGDITWISDQELGTDVTVLLPQDLSRTTNLAQGSEPIHVCLILSQQAEVIRALAGLLQAQGALVIIARSLDEAQEKSTILSPTVVMIDGQYASTCDESLLIHYLMHPVGLHQATLIGLGSVPAAIANAWPKPIEVWTWPLPEERVHVTLAKVLQSDHSSVVDKSQQSQIQISEFSSGGTNSSRSLVLLQLDLAPGLQAPEPIVVDVLTQLTCDYGCSMLTVNDAEQAMLLARIWQPKVLICPGTIPNWVIQCSQNFDLLQIPLVVLGVKDRLSVPVRSNPFPWIIPYPVAAELDAPSLKAVTHHLYQQLVQLAGEGRRER